jgi:hypothetical protein
MLNKMFYLKVDHMWKFDVNKLLILNFENAETFFSNLPSSIEVRKKYQYFFECKI